MTINGGLDFDDISLIADALLTKGHLLGIFESANRHESKSAPLTNQLHLDMFGVAMTPLAELSGLNSVSVRVEFQMNILKDMFSEADQIDPKTMGAAGRLMNAFAGGFTLGGEVHAVDVLGAYGESLRAQAGYVSIGGGQGGSGARMFRVMSVFVPVILADCWTIGV